jgi:hypothetical protein
MPKSSSPGVQRTYLNVPYAEKDKAKDKGARWDADRKKWYVVGKEVPEGLESYVTNTPKSYSLPTSGLVDENDPSLYGSWLLGHEGEPWASVRNLAPKS